MIHLVQATTQLPFATVARAIILSSNPPSLCPLLIKLFMRTGRVKHCIAIEHGSEDSQRKNTHSVTVFSSFELLCHAELSVCAELGKVVSFTLSPRTAEIWWRCYAHTAPAIDYSHLSCGVKFNYLS